MIIFCIFAWCVWYRGVSLAGVGVAVPLLWNGGVLMVLLGCNGVVVSCWNRGLQWIGLICGRRCCGVWAPSLCCRRHWQVGHYCPTISSIVAVHRHSSGVQPRLGVGSRRLWRCRRRSGDVIFATGRGRDVTLLLCNPWPFDEACVSGRRLGGGGVGGCVFAFPQVHINTQPH